MPNSTPLAIRADRLSKRFRLGTREELPDSLVSAALKYAKRPWKNLQTLRNLSRFNDADSPDILWALKDLSIEIRRGEVIGFIGRNGAGKSTFLKILSRITDPTSGQVEIFGRVSSLLEVGTGFHPELTGRENVYLNGTILGMKKREIDRKFDEIVEFAGVGRFIETPVKRYSSGMMVRLAFAVAAHLEPEILIVDEVLAVGDAQFQQKSIGKMHDVARDSGRTVLFVSHNMGCIERLCERVAVMNDGQITKVADPKTAIRDYLRNYSAAAGQRDVSALPREGDGRIRLVGFGLRDDLGQQAAAALTGQNVTFVLPYASRGKSIPRNVSVGLSVHTMSGECLFIIFTHHSGHDFSAIPVRGAFECSVRRLPLNPGRYLVYARIEIHGDVADCPTEPIGCIDVEAGDFYGTGKLTTDRGQSLFLVDAEWRCGEHPEAPAVESFSSTA